MNGKDLHDSMAYLDDDLIYEAEVTKFRKSPWKSVLASAAVLVLLVGTAATFISPIERTQPQLSAPTDPLPEAEESALETEEPAFETPQWDVNFPVMEDEFVLSNGVQLGMTFEDVVRYVRASTDSAIEFDGQEYSFSFVADDVLYDFSRVGDSPRILTSLTIGPDSPMHFGRDFHIGESMDDVFAKIPARDTELKKWRIQTLYEGENYSANLQFLDLRYYAMMVYTPTASLRINFSDNDMQIQSMEICTLQKH